MRASAALFIAVGLVAGLAACSTPGDPSTETDAVADPAACLAESGAATEEITVEGAFGEAPAVNFDFPLEVDKTQRAVVVEGEGEAVASGDVISTSLVMYNGTTGEEIPSGVAPGEAAELTVSNEAVLPGLVNALQCTTAGSRVVAVIPPGELWRDEGVASLNISGTDNIVMVADVVEIVPPPAPLVTSEWTEDLPKLDLDGDTPTVTLPQGEAPTDLQLAVLKEGDGAVVEATDTVTLDYQGTSWQTREVFDQSYDREPITHAANGFVPGFTAALVGQKVGAQLLVTIPAENAYGTDADAHPLGGQALVFLIEIKGVA